ncbi:Keratin, type I cytoskeletal 27 [Merluccius polli]|uniref:Keratin, type I cytoskeletal 27 n=1 Tax=Merluccius polli TaxID=89951 RepID=A0AA47MQU0_MERPO|nr:Keratin, type I cytoskeletal 27 [Merluccius polli]
MYSDWRFKVQALEAANEMLEMQIKELLDRKSPSDLIKLDRHLDIVNMLHSQITKRQTVKAQTKLQLVSLVLEASDLSARLDVARGQSVHLQAHLEELRLLREQMRTHTLPGLCRLVSLHTQELTELQTQHLQDVQGLCSQVSGEISMQLLCAESSKLSHQLETFRDESLNVMMDKNQEQNNHWFNTQASMLTCKQEETQPSSRSEDFQTELTKLRVTKLMLEEELTKLQTQKIILEESDLSLTEGYRIQLAQLQQRADGLGQQLGSILPTMSKQAEEYQALLHIKSSLEREIEDYTTLLDMNHDRTLSYSYQNRTSVTPLNVQTSGRTFQNTAMIEHDNRVLAQTRTPGSELNAQESRVDPKSVLHISESTSTQTSIRSHQVNLAEDTPRKYPPSLTSISTSGLLDLSLTSSENQIQSITKEHKGTLTGIQEGESKIASLEMKKQIILLERQVQSQQTPTKNTIIVDTSGVQEITGSTLHRQITKQVTNTVTEITVKNTNIQHSITKAALPETHTISDGFISTTTAIESQLEKEHAISSQLSSTSCDMQMSERSGIESNVCQIISLGLKAAVPTGTAKTDIVAESTVVDLKVSQAQTVTSIERPTEEETHVGNNTSWTVQGDALDIHQKSQSVEITAVGNHLEKAIQAKTDGDAFGQAWSSVDEAHISTVVDVRARMESNTYSKESTEDTSDQVEGTVVKLQASTVTKIVGGIKAGGSQTSNVENKADDSFGPLLAIALRIKEEADDVEQSALTSFRSSDDIGSINHTPLSENSPIPAVTDTCTIIEHREEAVNIDNAVPQVQIITFVETTLHVQEVEKSLTHCALMTEKIVEQEQEEKELEEVDTTLHAIDSLLPDLPRTIEQGDQVHENVVYPNLDSEVTVVVEVNQKGQETSAILKETETGMTSDTLVGCEGVNEVHLSQKHPDLSLSPEDIEMCLSLDKTKVFSSTTRPGVSEVKCVTRDSDSLLSQLDPHSSLSQNKPGPVDTNEILNQNNLEMCVSPVYPEAMNQNELETCLSPVDTDIMTQNELEKCFSPVDNDILSPNELEACFSPVDNDILSSNELEACFSPVDNDILSPNDLKACLNPDTKEAVDADCEECFSPSDDVCTSPMKDVICSPVRRYILSTKVDEHFLSFSGNQSLMVKDKTSKVSEPLRDVYSFSKVQSFRKMHISKTDAGSTDVANRTEGRYRNRSIEGIGQEAFSPVGSPPENTYRKLSLGDREDTRFHSISRGTWGLSANKSLDGQKNTELTATSMSPGSCLTADKSHCFRSVPFTRGASFNSMASNTAGAKGQHSNTGHTPAYGGAKSGTLSSSGKSMPAVGNNRATSPGGRLFSGGSGEWKVYGGSVGRTSNAGSASGSSVGSDGRLARSGSVDRISCAPGSHVASGSRRYGSMGSGESKPVYGSASGRISGAVRQSGVPGSNRAPSPGTRRMPGSTSGSGGRLSGGSGGRISSAFGGTRMSSSGSGGKHSHSGSSDRLSGGQILRISSSTAGQVRTNSMGGRLISSSDRPAGSTGSGVGANKERISVCKRAALSISAAGRERSQEKHRATQKMASGKGATWKCIVLISHPPQVNDYL